MVMPSVTVTMTVIVSVSVAVVVTVTVIMPVSVAMTMMMVMTAHSPHSKQVHRQSSRTDDEELRRIVHLRRLEDPLDGFKDDEDADEDQEDPVGEATERLDSAVAVREDVVGTPGAHDAGE